MDPSARQDFLFNGLAASGAFRMIAVTDADGRVTDASDPTTLGGIRLDGQAYFAAHRVRPDNDLLITGPLQGIAGNRRVIILSRRRYAIDGGFAGIVIGSIELTSVQDVMRRLTWGEGRNATLGGGDSRLLVRYPGPRRPATNDIGETALSNAPPRRVARRQPTGTFATLSPLDGSEQIFAYRKIPHTSLTLSIAIDTTALDKPWRHRAWIAGASIAAVDMGAILLCAGVRRDLRRRLNTEHVALVSERQFRLKIENIGGHAIFSL
ncbi:MAG TPA: hypothetical protein VIG49_08835, partial [Acetobacteraceae bacterium]